jgi:Arc/MetJ-type ribon-helix-helix transcriptional regulator
MTINLIPEQERIIQAEIDSGHFRNTEEVLDYALATLRKKRQDRQSAARQKNLAQFLMESPFAGAALNLDRQKDYGRPIDL